MSCHVMSCGVMLCHVMLCGVMWCDVVEGRSLAYLPVVFSAAAENSLMSASWCCSCSSSSSIGTIRSSSSSPRLPLSLPYTSSAFPLNSMRARICEACRIAPRISSDTPERDNTESPWVVSSVMSAPSSSSSWTACLWPAKAARVKGGGEGRVKGGGWRGGGSRGGGGQEGVSRGGGGSQEEGGGVKRRVWIKRVCQEGGIRRRGGGQEGEVKKRVSRGVNAGLGGLMWRKECEQW